MCSKSELQVITRSVIDGASELMENKIYKIILYGSYARGDFDSESDVDIMILFDGTLEEAKGYRKQLSRLASRIGMANDIEVSLLVRDKSSFESGLTILPFYQNVQNEGIVIYGA